MYLTKAPAAGHHSLALMVCCGFMPGKALTSIGFEGESKGQLAYLAGLWAQLIPSTLHYVENIFAYHESDH